MANAVARSENVFIVGCGRSGTTLLYELLATHSAFAWTSTWTDRALRPSLAALNWSFRWSRRGATSHRGIPRPSEGYRLWDAALGRPGGAVDGVLTEKDVDVVMARRSRAMADGHRRWARSPIFLNKNTRNSRRIAALAAIFPDATVVHVLRSPLDVVSSLLSVSWWRDLELWTHGGERPGARSPEDQARMAAELWVREVDMAAAGATQVAPGRYSEVHYEHLLKDPAAVIATTLDRLDLPMARSTRRAIDALTVLQRSGSYRTRLTAEQQRAAWSVVAPMARQYGYAGDAPAL